MKVRRPEQLLLRWVPEGLEAGVPGRRQWIRLSDDLRKVLDRAGDGIELDDLAGAFGAEHAAGVREAVGALLRLGVLVAVDGADRMPPLWQRWGGLAQRLHIEARDADYLVDSPGGPTRRTPSSPRAMRPRRSRSTPTARSCHCPAGH